MRIELSNDDSRWFDLEAWGLKNPETLVLRYEDGRERLVRLIRVDREGDALEVEDVE